ncbi:MAG TPA: hypothetical protein VFV93_16975 [Thermomicrobiales bacterium]|nr:hypothetical protein [Thermomicrobiales bacterium]
MSRDEDTGELPVVGNAGDARAPGEPVGRVNLPDETDLQRDPSGLADDRPAGASAAVAPDSMREKVLFGLMAVVMMILAMIVILQGVFEQKMPI